MPGFQGYLVKVGNTRLDNRFISPSTYQISPHQRLETKAGRTTTGVLSRSTVSHAPTKIEFSTPYITNDEFAMLMSIIRSAYTIPVQRALNVTYWDPEVNDYHTAAVKVYQPDYTVTIAQVSNTGCLYEPVRLAFIEY